MKMEICPDMKLNVFFMIVKSYVDRNVGRRIFCFVNPSEDYRNLKFVHYSTTDGLVNNMVSLLSKIRLENMDYHSVWFISFFT